MLSIIFSTFNEANNRMLFLALDKLIAKQQFEIICVDGGSSDGSLEQLAKLNLTLLNLENSTRAARLNLGIKHAKNQQVLLHHPRSILSDQGINFLENNREKIAWGAFTHKFDNSHYFLKFISWYSNNVRVKRKNVVYLDHCILIDKKYLNQDIPDIAIFEDTALSEILASQGLSAKLLPFSATTSAIRFLNRGIYKQFFMNQFLKFLYSINFDASKMNKLYEKHLNLNQKN